MTTIDVSVNTVPKLNWKVADTTITTSEVRGIDVSKWQGFDIDWPRVAVAGYSFVFLRSSVSLRRDETYELNYKKAGEAGLLRGAYHYLSSQQRADDQSRLFEKIVNDIGPLELPMVCDVEESGLTLDDIRDFVQTLTVPRPMIYTSGYKWELCTGNTRWGSQYALWVAHYTGRASPYLPIPWSSWAFWQHSDEGRVDGIKYFVDLNRFNGTLEQLRTFV